MDTAFMRIVRLTQSGGDHKTGGAGVRRRLALLLCFHLFFVFWTQGEKRGTQKTKTATVSNRHRRTRTDAMVLSTTLYIYILVHFCLTIDRKCNILSSVPLNTFPALDGARRGARCEEQHNPTFTVKLHHVQERRSRKRYLLRPWLAGRARARGEAVFRLSIQRIPCKSGSCK